MYLKPLLAILIISGQTAAQHKADTAAVAEQYDTEVHHAKISCEADTIYGGRLLDEVVVTGTRSPRFLKDTPVQTRLITSADIMRTGAADIQQLLEREMPGVEFSYAMNQQTHLNLGGFGGQSVLFLVDGERMAGETMDDIDFRRITMDNVERIEIVRGAVSALYGSNATGGVVNIITRRADSRRIRLEGSLSKHDTQRWAMTWSEGCGSVANALSLTATSTDNYDVKSAPSPVTRVISTIYGDRVYNVKDRFTWKAGSRITMSARAGYFFRETERSKDCPERYRGASAGLGADVSFGDGSTLKARYSFDQYDKSDYQRIAHTDIRDYSNVQNSMGVTYVRDLGTSLSLTAGGDYMHDWLYNSHLAHDTRKQYCLDAFAQLSWRMSDRVETVAALRYDHFSDGSLSRLTPKATVCYRPSRDMTLRAGYGMGFRAPTLKEKYYDFDMSGIWIVEGNPHLRPETSHNYSVSMDYRHNSLDISASLSYSRVKDKIASCAPYFKQDSDKIPYLPYANMRGTDVYGGELSVRHAWPCGLSARVGYAYTKESSPRDADGNRTGSQYIPAREHSLSARLDYVRRLSDSYSIYTGLDAKALSGVDSHEYANYYDLTQGMVRVHYPAYALCNLYVTQHVAQWLHITLCVDNLLNYRPKYYYLNSPLTDGMSLRMHIAADVDRLWKR